LLTTSDHAKDCWNRERFPRGREAIPLRIAAHSSNRGRERDFAVALPQARRTLAIHQRTHHVEQFSVFTRLYRTRLGARASERMFLDGTQRAYGTRILERAVVVFDERADLQTHLRRVRAG